MALDLDINTVMKEFDELSEEYKSASALHQQYKSKLEELATLQSTCIKNLSHQRYCLNIIRKSTKSLENQDKKNPVLTNLKARLTQRQVQLDEMKEALPKNNGLYLGIILGNVNVSILNKNDKFKYKDEYEKFKFIVNLIVMILSAIDFFMESRVLDLLIMFLLVWYYCTLTIRESILKVNGSRVKGWWRAHHFMSTAISGVLLIWPNNIVYYECRPYLMSFILYISLIQFVQFRYQRGCLYRLRALGERPNMDITIEGFHSWMWAGLSFLLPLLFFGYMFQLYNALILYELSYHEEATWQVPTLSGLLLLVSSGNILTTMFVIPQKLKEKVKLKQRLTVLHKYLSRNNSSIDLEKMNNKQS